VGFIMVGQRAQNGSYWLSKLMIDACERRKGYGTAAMQAAIQLLRNMPGCTSVQISYQRNNVGAAAMLGRLGFVPEDTGSAPGSVTAVLHVCD
jgi:diamine N-acetyltransferase